VLYRLAEQEVRVRALVRPGTSPDRFDRVREAFPRAEIELCPASLQDMDALGRALTGVQMVLHVAASKNGAAAAQVANTVVGSERLYRQAVAAKVERFVLVSSFGVMGASSLESGALVDEKTSLEPHPEWRDPYSFAKHRQEQLAWKYHREAGLPLVVVRPGVIFGPGQNILTTRIGLNLFGIFLHLGGRNRIPLTYVDNCADAVVRAGMAAGVVGEIFCIVDDDLPTSRELLRRYRREVQAIPYLTVPYPLLLELGRLNAWYSERTRGHLPAIFTPYKVAGMWGGHRFSNQRAKERLGWSVSVPMQRALDLTFAAQTRPTPGR
jgi:nucleoside-diphosphate-sugar epimerase